MPNFRSEVESVLEVIRNALRMDGGDIELVDINDDGVVSVRLTGSCAGCPFSQMTLKNFVERELKKNVDGIREVVAV
ncbi:NifU family protein [Methanotrichaceae archaeon M04Ac]|jgi:Fe-S cluster biogenesis protein NfuA|uniref:NifU family protein n=1 Tax=Candidatus Methanocrinis alkalitolerans TaxID=3033395 RepID=A0ABT5XF19_9EURY|nr:NifU family protein [Candidatus Methanocrinis alkalitolerans]MCR3883614.1 NifU family protein [Methanothrix sp.]MDF0593317.1 NifU family protein [Candidatus Methanocrinis alkalitolerans]